MTLHKSTTTAESPTKAKSQTSIGKTKASNSKILGHRGARYEVLENSLAGFIHSHELIKNGLEGIEFDVQLTADGRLIVFHDDSISRLFNQQGHVDQLPANFFDKTPIWSDHQPHQIITLDKMPPLLQGYRHIELEVKTHPRTNHCQLLKTLRAYLADFPKDIAIRITSFDTKFLALMQTDNSLATIPRGLLTAQPTTPQALVYRAMQLECTQVGVKATLITPEIIKHCHQYQLSVTAWTVNDSAQAKDLLDMSIDWIITDNPSRFLVSL